MNELQTAGVPTKPLSIEAQTRRDEMALKGLTSLINNPEFADGNNSGKFDLPMPPDMIPNPAEVKSIFKPRPANLPGQNVRVDVRKAEAPVVEKEVVWPAKIFTTGRLAVGKDTFLNKIGRPIQGFADPLYAIQKAFFGTDDKKAPGARAFLQQVGQWGRGTVTDKYPITAERAVFVTLIAAMGESLGFDVDWKAFGKTDSIWVDALISRTAALDRLGVSNVRFKNEREALTDAGFTHFHVMCSPQTLAARHAAAGIPANSPTLTDISEQMAISLDKAALDAGSKPGNKLRVIWSDDKIKSPSARFITL